MNDISGVVGQRPYHHGDLKAALLREAERILECDGIQALTLRAAARAAGVSHAAPANHFGDLTGLLSELAAVGFRRFSAALTAAGGAAGDNPRDRSRAMGRAYVTFARTSPGLFALMFRSERLDSERPALRDGLEESRATLRGSTGESGPAKGTPPLRMAAAGVARWSLVHGFAMLLLDGRLDRILGGLPDDPTADDLLDAVLGIAHFGE
jgi:AcrR family transcriptional regulator